MHHRGGGFGGGAALGLGLAVGGMVLDQVQRQQAQEPRDIPVRGNFDNPRTNKNTASQSRGKKNDEPVVRRKKDDPVIAKRTDGPRRGKKDEPTRRTDESNGTPHHPPATTTEKTSEPRPKKPPEDRFEVPHSPPILVSNPDTPVVPATPPTRDTPANPPTKVTTATPQTPAKTQTPSTPGPCNDHFAELTNGKRVFHRLFVVGYAKNENERKVNERVHSAVKSALTGSGRQAPGSTAASMNQPTVDEFAAKLKEIMAKAKPCEEITLWMGGHGAGGSEAGPTLPPNGSAADKELKAETFQLGKGDKASDHLSDRYLGKLVKDNLKPDVSFTAIMSSCWGGGFAGKGNVEESKLVQVIGLKGMCPGSGFDESIINGLDKLGGESADKQVYVNRMKVHLVQNGWALGEPSDTLSNVPQGNGK